MHPEPEESVPVAPKARWVWTVVVFEVGLIIIMLISTGTWPVRGVVIVDGAFLVASLHAYWRAYGMLRDGAPWVDDGLR
jgi:uncharacterized membrane protein YphA (DoxX/SURF4 family)